MSTDVAKDQIDWPAWLRRWDAQQEGYVPEREARFTAMFDVLETLLPASFVALDLACGPGSISQRLLARFPQARAVAVDMDPVMVTLGREALGTFDGRLRWVTADLSSSDWLDELGEARVDVALSSTAIHWLPAKPLTRLYHDLGRLLPSGGLLLTADHLAFGSQSPTFARVSDRALDHLWSDASFAVRGIETAEQWWAAISQEPGIEPLLAERSRIFASKRRAKAPDFDFHVSALRDAGFSEVGTVWQVLSDRILMAVR
jgi:trans-aconitate methyltransferase